MWTTSSSRAEAGTRLCALALLAAAAPATAERPLPAIARAPAAQLASPLVRTQPVRIAIRSARLLPAAAADKGAARLLEGNLRRSGGLVAVDVAEPLDLTRSALPVLLVDGKAVESAVSRDAPRTIVGLLPVSAARAGIVTVRVAWQGDFERTLSAPVRFALRR